MRRDFLSQLGTALALPKGRMRRSFLRDLSIFIISGFLTLSGAGATSLGHSESSQGLGCMDFHLILNFVKQQHLRFQYAPPASGDHSLIDEAKANVPQTLLAMGYPMMSA